MSRTTRTRLDISTPPLQSGGSPANYPFKQVFWVSRLIAKGIIHHFTSDYETSISILVAQIDGLGLGASGADAWIRGATDYEFPRSPKMEAPSSPLGMRRMELLCPIAVRPESALQLNSRLLDQPEIGLMRYAHVGQTVPDRSDVCPYFIPEGRGPIAESELGSNRQKLAETQPLKRITKFMHLAHPDEPVGLGAFDGLALKIGGEESSPPAPFACL